MLFFFPDTPMAWYIMHVQQTVVQQTIFLSLIQNIRVEAAVPLVIIFFCHDYNLRQLRQVQPPPPGAMGEGSLNGIKPQGKKKKKKRQVQFKTMSPKFETRDEYNLRQVIDYLE